MKRLIIILIVLVGTLIGLPVIFPWLNHIAFHIQEAPIRYSYIVAFLATIMAARLGE